MAPLNTKVSTQDDSDLVRIISLFTRNYKVYLICVFVAVFLAFLVNRFAIPRYRVISSLMIIEDHGPKTANVNEYIDNEMFGLNQGFQNEQYILRSTPIVEQTVKNLDLTVNYYLKTGFRYMEAYKQLPIHVLTLKNHVQPVFVKFQVSIHNNREYTIKAESKKADFVNLYSGQNGFHKENWVFEYSGKFGNLVENQDLAFVVQLDTNVRTYIKDEYLYYFDFKSVASTTDLLKSQLDFRVTDREATIIEIGLETTSSQKGLDVVNEMMDVYSTQNVNRKNHIAEVTIEYIERQLGEISDSLSQTEDNLQQFRSSRQLLNVNDQASGMSEQYMTLQNQLAELVTQKRYYDYLAEYLTSHKDFTNMIVPESMGIQDQMLNTLVSQLLSAQAQRSNLIRNRQEKNPLVQRLEIQIENTKRNITDNISAVRKTTDISIDEMNKRINRIKSEISRVPKTQRQLSGIERNYRLNDAIYNYLLEKRAEAKISQASNLPDNIVVEPATLRGIVSPNHRKNYLFALVLSLIFPFAFFYLKSMLNEKIEYQGKIDNLTDAIILGKIPHTRRKTNNVVFEYPRSTIAEAYRALRTNIEYRFKDIPQKVIFVSSSIEGEGKSFTSMNLAMSYAQLGRRTLLVDFDLRKPTGFFSEKEISPIGLSSYFINQIGLDKIIMHSPHAKLDYIPSGPIPPNPIEILASIDIPGFVDLLKEEYECIILDSTPLAQVSDAYLLLDYANIRIIVARYNFTLKKVFHMVMKDLKEKKIDNVCVVMNDNKIYRDQYGYGYGYDKKKHD